MRSEAEIRSDARLTAEQVAAIQARCDKATEGPWAWEWIAEKSNEWAVGEAWDNKGAKLAGRTDRLEETIIERRLVGLNESGHAVAADADFIAHARQDVPDLLAALAQAEREREDAERKFQRSQQRWGHLKAAVKSEITYFTGSMLTPQQRSQYANGVARLTWVLDQMAKSPDVLAELPSSQVDAALAARKEI
jgi:hypothetical protein